MNNIVKKIGGTFKVCSAGSCKILPKYVAAIENDPPKLSLSAWGQKNFDAATTEKTNCTNTKGKRCNDMNDRVKKATRKLRDDTTCTNTTCLPLYQFLDNLKGQSPPIIISSSRGFGVAAAPLAATTFLTCSGGFPISSSIATFHPEDDKGLDNLTFESCQTYCAGFQAPYMALGAQTMCSCHAAMPQVVRGEDYDDEDSNRPGPYKCGQPCFGDGDAVFGSGCGEFLYDSSAYYKLDYATVV